MASRGVNKVIIAGRLGQDPELRYTSGGDAVASFSLATSETWKDKQTGEQREESEWHRCISWRRVAEIIGEHAKKGAMLYVEGKLKTRKWQDATGADKYSTEIIVENFQFLGSRPEGASEARKEAPKAQQQSKDDDFYADDIPF